MEEGKEQAPHGHLLFHLAFLSLQNADRGAHVCNLAATNSHKEIQSFCFKITATGFHGA